MPGTSAARARRSGARAKAPATASACVEMRVDCDQDSVWIKVEQAGPGACHTGRRSCFYRAVPLGKAGAVTLEFRDGDKTFDPKKVYGEIGRPTSRPPRWRAPATAWRVRCGRSYITPSMPTTPAPGLAAKAAITIARAWAICSGDGVKTSLMTGDLRRMDRHLAGEAVAAGFLAFAAQAVRRCENRHRPCRSPAPARPRRRRGRACAPGGRDRGSGRPRRGWLRRRDRRRGPPRPRSGRSSRGLAPR